MIDVLLFYLKILWFSLWKISLLFLYLGQILPNLVQFFITYSHIVIIWNTAAEDCSISSLHFRYFFRFFFFAFFEVVKVKVSSCRPSFPESWWTCTATTSSMSWQLTWPRWYNKTSNNTKLQLFRFLCF